MKITDTAIKRLKTPEKGAQITYDSEIPGFGIRITSQGVKSFILNYRIFGRERRYTIGRYVPGRTSEWNSESARDEAVILRRQISHGIDPLDEKQKAYDAPTVSQLADEFKERYVKPYNRESTEKQYNILLDNWIIPKLGKRKVASITHMDVETLHQSMKETPYQANRALAVLSKMFNLALRWEWCTINPAKGIQRYQEEKRERYLNPDELKSLVEALAAYPKFITKAGDERIDARKEQTANILRLVLLTGARRNEVMSAKWDQFDLQAGIWTKPSAHTKQNKIHRVPLSAPALELLVDIKNLKYKSDYLFPGPTKDSYQTDIKNGWKAICKLAKLKDVRIHDLRHSYASNLASAGLSLPIIGALLGHTQAATTSRYAHLMDDPLREATERVGAIVEHARTGKTAEVVPIEDAKK